MVHGMPSDAMSQPTFRELALMLRGRAGLTQRELAARLGVSDRAIQKWEAGLSTPSLQHLTSLIAIYLQQGIFVGGVEEVQALWAASRLGTPFDAASLTVLPGSPVAPSLPPRTGGSGCGGHGRQDWGEAPDV